MTSIRDTQGRLSGLLVVALALAGCGAPSDDAPASDAVTPEEARVIARDAYVYGFPMVMSYKALYNYVVDERSPEYKGPFNQVTCEARLFTPEDKAVVTPNSDTPYCMYWMDLRTEPLVLSVPEMEPERYYHVQFIDLYTHNLAYVGTLTTGNGAGQFLVAGPDWSGETPEGIADVIQSETDFMFHVVRTQLFGPDDLEKVKTIQESYGLQPLSAFLGTERPAALARPDFPEWVDGSELDERFLSYLDFMLSLLEEPGEGEAPLWDRLARLGIGRANDFDLAAVSPEIRAAFAAGIEDGLAAIRQFVEDNGGDPLISAKIFGTREFLTNSALNHFDLESPSMLRSVAAQRGLFGNSGHEAIYPTYLVDVDGEPLDASANRYTLTFDAGRLPPVEAFWSLTMYDGKTQLFIHNPLDRYLLNSTMMAQFELASDGSLTLSIQKDSPGKALEGNWLPAPDGPFYMVMRLYGPRPEALDGTWTPPAVHKVD